MPSRLTFAAMALTAPLLFTACEREAQQQVKVEQPGETQTAEPESAEPAEPAGTTEPQTQPAEPEPAQTQPAAPPQEAEQQAPAAQEPAGQTTADSGRQSGDGEGEILVVPPADEAASDGEGQTPQGNGGQGAAQAPGEPSPQAAGVASVAAYVGRWAEETQTCERSYWTFTNLRLQSPDGQACDIQSTEEREDGIDLEVACTDRGQPLAEPRRDTMSLSFPNLPQTETMAVSGGPVGEEERTLSRCPLG